MFLTVFLLCTVLGCIVGFFAGLLGIGGGLIIVPALVYLLAQLEITPSLIMPMAIATSLATIVITSFSAALVHHKNKNIAWPITKRLMIMVAIGSFSGGYIADSISSDALTYFFSLAVLLLAFYMLFSIQKTSNKSTPANNTIRITGLCTGIIASLMGIAGGAILVPVLSYFGMPIKKSIATATVCGVIVAIFGSLGFILTGLTQENLPEWSFGYVYLPALFGIIITSAVVAPFGVKMSAKLPVKMLKKCFAVFLIIVAIKMMV